jgi:hypothetical protein
MHMFRFIFVMLLALAGPAHLAAAETITVCASGCDYTSINVAIDAASDGDVIQLAAETYYEGAEIVVVGKSVTIAGARSYRGEPLTVVMGNGTHRLLRFVGVETAGSAVESISFQLGRTHGENVGGAGVLAESGIVCRDCEFVDNAASGQWWEHGYGGGTRGPIHHDRCLFLRNSAYYGGGSAEGTYRSCDFVDNECVSNSGLAASQRGAAVWGSDAVEGCTFSGNIGQATVVYSNLYDCTFFDGTCMADGREFIGCRFEGASSLGFCDWTSCGQIATVIDCFFANGMGRPGFGAVFQRCIFEGESLIFMLGGKFEDCEFNNGTQGAQILGEERGCLWDGGEPWFRNCRFRETCPGDPLTWHDLGGNKFAGLNASSCGVDFCLSNLSSGGQIDAEGLGLLIAIWGWSSPCDVDHDGVIGPAELGEFLASWGQCP